MATQNLIIQKLQERIGRINDMVRIGNPLPDSSRSTQTKQIPPGHRFIHAAKQMRILDKKKLGNIQPEDLSQAGRSLTTKFENVNQLLRLPPKSKSDSSFWSDVDKTYYNQAGGESQGAPPKQGGTFQRGTVIQKHSMFPSEGQSLENFLQQSKNLSQKSRPKPSTPRRATPKRRPPTPNKRLYSRVEEIAKDKPAEITPENIPAQTPPPPAQDQKTVEKSKSSKPAASTKTALPSADVKQPEPPKFELREAKTQKDAPATSSKPASAPPASTPTPKKSSAPSTDTQTPASLETAPKKADPTTPPPQASKKPTPPIAQAKPKVKSAPKSVQRQLAKPKPQSPAAKAPSTAPEAKEKSTGQTPPDITTSPQKSDRAEAEAPFAQESKPRAAAPPPQMDLPHQQKTSAPTKIEDGERQKQSAPPSKEISPADIAPKSKKADLPLQDQITKRHKQPNKFLSLDKEILKPSIKPKDLPIFTNTIKPDPTSTPPEIPADQDQSMPKLPTEFEAFAPARGLSPQTVFQAPAPSKPKMPESMQPLQMEFPKKQTIPAPMPPEPENAKPASQKPEIPRSLPSPSNVPSPAPANTVQRIIDTTVPEIEKNITGAVKGLMGGQSQKVSSTAPQLDLDALAKDMLPMIKRLLEIEAERSSRFFR